MIDWVRNNSRYPLFHQRVVLDWTKIHPIQIFDSARLDEIAYIRIEDDPTPPTCQNNEILIASGESSRFTAAWKGWDHTNLPLSGEIELDLSFNFAGFPFTCRVVRTVTSTSPTMTPTPTTP